jgi:acyl dehydratase
MPRSSVITPEMRSQIGTTGRPVTFDIEKGAIRKYAEAVEDPNPLWVNETLAREAGYEGIVAPPVFLHAVAILARQETAGFTSPLPNLLNGGQEFQYLAPIGPGDTITATCRLADLVEKDGRLGKMLFVVYEIVCDNQRGQTVARVLQTTIAY